MANSSFRWRLATVRITLRVSREGRARMIPGRGLRRLHAVVRRPAPLSDQYALLLEDLLERLHRSVRDIVVPIPNSQSKRRRGLLRNSTELA